MVVNDFDPTKPVEAYLNGCVVPVTLKSAVPDWEGDYELEGDERPSGFFWVNPHRLHHSGWRLRNTASDAPTSPAKGSPDADSIGQCESMGHERLKALCGNLIKWYEAAGVITLTEILTEARSIMRSLDPVSLLIDDLMAQDLPERDRIAKAYEAGRKA